jgi:hypothetical protein
LSTTVRCCDVEERFTLSAEFTVSSPFSMCSVVLPSPPRLCAYWEPYLAAELTFVPRLPYPDHIWREYGETVSDDIMFLNRLTAAWNVESSVPGGGVGNFMGDVVSSFSVMLSASGYFVSCVSFTVCLPRCHSTVEGRYRLT